MSKRLAEVDSIQKEVHEKNKIKFQQYQHEIDMREMEINRIKRILDKKDTDCNIHCANLAVAEERAKDLEEELELKSGENNRLRK